MQEMYATLQPQLKDPARLFGAIEKELIYYRDKKRCQVCDTDVTWAESEYHHVDEHFKGETNNLGEWRIRPRALHPKGQAAVEFALKHKAKIAVGKLTEGRPKLECEATAELFRHT